MLLLIPLALPVSGQDVTGTWVLAVNLGPGGGGSVTLVLEQDGADVSGTYTGLYGTSVPISGTAEGGQIMLSLTTEGIGEITYDGEWAADSMWGSATYGTASDGTFQAYMRPPATIVSTVVGYGVLALLLLLAVGVMLGWRPRR